MSINKLVCLVVKVDKFDVGRTFLGIMANPGTLARNLLTRNLPHKPPNVLVYSEASDFVAIKTTLVGILNNSRYTIYHLTDSLMNTTPWTDNAELLIVTKNCLKDKTQLIVDYNSNGGKLVTACCDVVQNILKVPKITLKQSKVLTNLNYKNETMKEFQCDVLTCDEPIDKEWVTLSSFGKDELPVILSRPATETTGPIIASLIQLFIPSKDSSSSKEHETHRLHILRDLLESELNLDCTMTSVPPLTSCYLLADSIKTKESFLEFYRNHEVSKGILKSKSLTYHLKTDAEATTTIDECDLPIIVEDQCSAFDTTTYFSHLRTKHFGRVVVFAEVVTSTMTILEGFHGFPDVVAIAKIQTNGKGRGGNAWLSPEGCAMFTFPLKFGTKSRLGQRPSFVQHMVALALVQSLKTITADQDLDLRIKWPNDIYIGSTKTKIGGLVITSTISESSVVCAIGCGLNVNNAAPTVCVNQLLEASGHSPVSIEQVIASTLNRMEKLLDEFQLTGPDKFISSYISNWLHCDAEVTLSNGHKAQVVGLDDFGYLRVRIVDDPQGEGFVSLHPDGNSFDMMRNLIIAKVS